MSSEPVVVPTEALPLPPSRSGRHRLVPAVPPAANVFPAVDPPPPLTVDLTTPVSILDNPDKDVTWQVNHLTREALRIIWHQRLGRMHSLTVSVHSQVRYWVPSVPIATEIDNCSTASQPCFTQPTSLPLLPATLLDAIKIFLLTLDLLCNLAKIASVFVPSAACIRFPLVRDRFSNTLYGAAVRRLSGLYCETSYVLLRDHFSNTLYGATVRSKASPIEWHLQLSQLKRIHAARAVADLLQTICQICGDEPDDAGTHELVDHIRGEDTPDEQAYGSFTRRKLKQLHIGDLRLASTGEQLAAHQKQKQNIFGVPHPTPPDATVLCSQLRYAQAYGSCINLPCTHLFFALSATISFVMMHPVAQLTDICSD
jgi:hypothetical protein